MATSLKNLASVEDIKLLWARAENHNLYVDQEEYKNIVLDMIAKLEKKLSKQKE